MKPTSQEARQIAEEGYNEGFNRATSILGLNKTKALTLPQFLKKIEEKYGFDAPTAGDEEDYKTMWEDLIIANASLINERDSYLQKSAPAPQNAAGEREWLIAMLSQIVKVIEVEDRLPDYPGLIQEAKELLNSIRVSPAPQNAAGDNWISVETFPETKQVNPKTKYSDRCIVTDGVEVFIAEVKEKIETGEKEWIVSESQDDLTVEKYFGKSATHWMPLSVLPSPPSPTAEQDKKI